MKAAFKILQIYDKQQTIREKTEVNNTFSLADLIAMSRADREAEKTASAAGKLIGGRRQEIEK